MQYIETISIPWHTLKGEKPTPNRSIVIKHTGSNVLWQNCVYIAAKNVPEEINDYDEFHEWAYGDEIASVRVEDAFVVKRTDDVYLSDYKASKGKPFEQWSPDIDDALVFPHDRVNEVVAALERYNFSPFRICSMHKD